MTELYLAEASVDPDPFRQFGRWLDEALALRTPVFDPTAMTLATAGADGQPAARMVLLKGFDERGFVFFTNYESAKARDLAENPRAALVFYWGPLERQVRVQGSVARVTQAESEAYFATRPRSAQLGAWASPQSTIIAGRAALEAAYAAIAARFAAADRVDLPPYWGGFRLAPHTLEFWQARPSRLHDRLRYLRQPDGGWRLERLAP